MFPTLNRVDGSSASLQAEFLTQPEGMPRSLSGDLL
jgi:hypothetical protein